MLTLIRLVKEFEAVPYRGGRIIAKISLVPIPILILFHCIGTTMTHVQTKFTKHIIVITVMIIGHIAILPNGQNSRDIPTPIAVIRRAPNRHQILVEMIFLPLHHQLVRPRDETQAVDEIKLIRHPRTEQKPRPPRTDLPRGADVLRIAPHQIAKRSVVRDLLLPIDRPYLVQRPDIRRQPAVHAQDLRINDGREGKGIEALRAIPPHSRIAVLAETLVVKPVHLRNLPRFVIAAQQRDVAGILELEAEEEREGFDAVVAAVDKVAEEDVVDVRRAAADLVGEEVEEVVELAVDVADDGDGGSHGLHVGFFHEQLGDGRAEALHGVFADGLSGFEGFDVFVYVVAHDFWVLTLCVYVCLSLCLCL